MNCNHQQTKPIKWLNKNVIIWSLFDFANSSFAVIVVAFVYAIYFKKIVAFNAPIADFYWSVSINISMITVAVLSPVLGASADYYSNKKKYLLAFTLLCTVTTALLYFVKEGMIWQGMLLFILANTGFQAGLGFYDAFLKEITEEENYNKVSSLGYAAGYAGSLFALISVFIFQSEPRLTFLCCAIIFLMFALPFFRYIKEKPASTQLSELKPNFIKIGFHRVFETLRHLHKYKNLRNYLLAYFIYIDGVNTIIFFSAIYAQTTLNFTISELILFFVIVQITALIGSLIFGKLADSTGTKKTLMLTLIGWTVLTAIVFFSNGKTSFLIIGGFAGLFLGSSQALSRSLMSVLTPDEKKTEFFGFYSLFEKTSTILGPLTFGLVSWLSGNQRYAVLSIVIFFLIGMAMLRNVRSPQKIKPDRF